MVNVKYWYEKVKCIVLRNNFYRIQESFEDVGVGLIVIVEIGLGCIYFVILGEDYFSYFLSGCFIFKYFVYFGLMYNM